MYYVRTQKINQAQNNLKFFNLEIRSDFFGKLNLCVEKGRIGQRVVAVVYASGTEEEMLAQLLVHATKRLRNGYIVTAFELPDQVRLRLEAYQRSRRRMFAPVERASANVHFDYAAIAQLVGETEPHGPLGPSITRLLESSDPRSKAKPRIGTEDQGTFHDLLQRAGLQGTSSCDPRREVLRYLAESLLRDDPRTLEGVQRALSVPSRPNAHNVVDLAIRRSPNYAAGVSLFEAFSSSAGLTRWAHRLADAGIRTMRDLVLLDLDSLCERCPIENTLLREADAICAKYGLRLGMTSRTPTGTA